MKCPNCGHGDSRVYYGREVDGRIRRRRECLKCTHRWFTVEVVETVFQRANDVIEAFKHLRGVVGDGE